MQMYDGKSELIQAQATNVGEYSGNLTKNANKDITGITYNVSARPTTSLIFGL